MNKILLTTLTTAMLATSGFAYDNVIDGSIYLKKNGGQFQSQGNNTLVKNTGSISLQKAGQEETSAKLIIDQSKELKLEGGTIQGVNVEGSQNSVLPQITLNGKLVLNKSNDIYPTLKDVVISSSNNHQEQEDNNIYGSLDMSSLNTAPAENQIDSNTIPDSIVPGTISGVSISLQTQGKNGVNVKLPFYCNFGKTGNDNNLDLRNAAKVEYTYLHIEDIKDKANPTNIKGSVNGTAISTITALNEKVIDESRYDYGHYAKNANLGVSLPTEEGKVEVTEVSCNMPFLLSSLAANMNLEDRYLNTNAFDEELAVNADSHVLTTAQEYKFGFAGTHPVSITLGERALEGSKATFSGDNRYYVPEDTKVVGENTVAKDGITLSKTTGEGAEAVTTYTPVEFAGENSLFPFNQTYGKGTFTAGTEEAQLSNTLPAGKTAEFKKGFSLGANHKLIVEGTLIG